MYEHTQYVRGTTNMATCGNPNGWPLGTVQGGAGNRHPPVTYPLVWFVPGYEAGVPGVATSKTSSPISAPPSSERLLAMKTDTSVVAGSVALDVSTAMPV